MPQYQHPGLYIQEIPAIPTIQGASTSIPVFIGLTETGPANKPMRITSWATYTKYFGGLAWGCYTPMAVFEFFAEGGGSAYVVNIDDSGTAPTATNVPISGWTINPASKGAWSSLIYVAVRDAGPVSAGAKNSNFFSISVMAKVDVVKKQADPANTSDPEALLAAQLLLAYIQNNALKIEPDPTTNDDTTWCTLETFGAFTAASTLPPLNNPNGAAPIMAQINAQSLFIRISAVMQGRPDNTFDATQVPSESLGGPDAVTQVYTAAVPALAAVQDISLVATPDLVFDVANQKAVINSLLGTCEANNLFYIIDPPYVADPTDFDTIVTFKSGDPTDQNSIPLESAYGALYFPWIQVLNQATNANLPAPPSGAVAGRYAYTDNSVGVHKAPAGPKDGLMLTVTGLTSWVTDAAQDALNPHGINAIRNLAGFGPSIYGARTLAIASDYTYVPIRRTISWIERSLRDSLQWVVFEPIGFKLWATVTREVTAFLTSIWRQGALFGGTADEAFFVTCDGTNNAPEDRAQGLLFVDIGVAPVYPAEFVIIRITQKTSAAS